MKKKIFFIILPIALFSVLVMLRSGAQKTEGQSPETTDKATSVKTQSVAQSKSLAVTSEYPAIINADQEATIAAKTTGTVTAVNFDLGKHVNTGGLLVAIDDTSANLSVGENNLKSAQVQQLEIAVQQAEKSYKLAKKNEDEDSTPSTRAAKNIAKLQLDNAEVALASALDAHKVIAPISGSIVSKNVSVGDSVSVGQTLAVISKTGKSKVSFFVEQEKVDSFVVGEKVSLVSSDNTTFEAIVANISPQADSATKRFQIDAQGVQAIPLPIGTVLSVRVQHVENTTTSNSLLIPLSALTIAPNENYFFVVENDLAKKVNFEIVRIFGENAEIKTDLAADTQIVVDGNKLLKDESKVVIGN